MASIVMAGAARGGWGRVKVGSPPPPGVIPLFTRCVWAGDSETGGRGQETPTATSPRIAFTNIWNENGFTAFTFNPQGSSWGQGGRSLLGTFTFLAEQTLTAPLTFFIQESGDQNSNGQRTPSEFAQTLYDQIVAQEARTPGSQYFYESAFSFGREADNWRDWHDYNAALAGVVSALAAVGITLTIVPVCEVIELLETQIDPNLVWYPAGHTQNYHFTCLGNFALAMTHYATQNHDIMTLAHTSIDIDSGLKAAAIAAVLEAA